MFYTLIDIHDKREIKDRKEAINNLKNALTVCDENSKMSLQKELEYKELELKNRIKTLYIESEQDSSRIVLTQRDNNNQG